MTAMALICLQAQGDGSDGGCSSPVNCQNLPKRNLNHMLLPWGLRGFAGRRSGREGEKGPGGRFLRAKSTHGPNGVATTRKGKHKAFEYGCLSSHFHRMMAHYLRANSQGPVYWFGTWDRNKHQIKVSGIRGQLTEGNPSALLALGFCVHEGAAFDG